MKEVKRHCPSPGIDMTFADAQALRLGIAAAALAVKMGAVDGGKIVPSDAL